MSAQSSASASSNSVIGFPTWPKTSAGYSVIFRMAIGKIAREIRERTRKQNRYILRPFAYFAGKKIIVVYHRAVPRGGIRDGQRTLFPDDLDIPNIHCGVH